MIIASFIISEAFIKQVLLKPEIFFGSKPTKNFIAAFKILASVLYYITMDTINDFFPESLNYNDDSIQKDIYSRDDIEVVLTEEWITKMKNSMGIWLERSLRFMQRLNI